MDIYPENSRTEIMKMIFDIDDIQALISKEFNEDNCLDKFQIKKVTL